MEPQILCETYMEKLLSVESVCLKRSIEANIQRLVHSCENAVGKDESFG